MGTLEFERDRGRETATAAKNEVARAVEAGFAGGGVGAGGDIMFAGVVVGGVGVRDCRHCGKRWGVALKGYN